MFILAILLIDHIKFTLILGPKIPGSYAILFFLALDFASTSRHFHNWASFLLQPKCFILSAIALHSFCGVAQSRTWLKWLSSSSIVQGSAYLLNNQSPTRNVTLVGWQQSAPMGWLPWASWLLSMISVSLHLQFLWSGNFGRKEANAGWLGQQVMTEDCLHCCGPRQTGISALSLIC